MTFSRRAFFCPMLMAPLAVATDSAVGSAATVSPWPPGCASTMTAGGKKLSRLSTYSSLAPSTMGTVEEFSKRSLRNGYIFAPAEWEPRLGSPLSDSRKSLTTDAASGPDELAL